MLTGLDATGRDRSLDALAAATPDGADGFDQSFGLLDRSLTPGSRPSRGWMSYGQEYLLHTDRAARLGQPVCGRDADQPTSAAGWDAARTTDDRAIAELLSK